MGNLVAKNVSKTFKKKRAICDLSVSFETGKVYGLLGRNSAGKTTLLKLLMTQYLPEEGMILYDGRPVYENVEALEKMCLFMDSMEAFTTYKVKDLLPLAAGFYKNWSEEMAEQLLHMFEIKKEDRYGTLSKGKQTAVSIVIGMASGCEITMFDEIYTGLDAVARKQFYDFLMQEYAESGRTFILSSHLIDEMSNLFTDVVIMEEGKVIVADEMEHLEASVISIRGTREQLDGLNEMKVLKESTFAGTVTRIVQGCFTEKIVNSYRREGVEVKRLSLQEIFIAIVQRDRRDGNGC